MNRGAQCACAVDSPIALLEPPVAHSYRLENYRLASVAPFSSVSPERVGRLPVAGALHARPGRSEGRIPLCASFPPRTPAPPFAPRMQPEPKEGRDPSRPSRPRSVSACDSDGPRPSNGTPPPANCDIACAIDALSCIESGDPSVLSLLSQTAYSLGVNNSSSSTSSNCSTSSFDDDDHITMNKRNQSDDDDINENFPVDSHKVAAISSAFSSHHLPPKRSKVHRIRTNFNKKLEPQQMAQFLLPLFTYQPEDIYSDQFVKIKHEDILQALTSANLTCDNEESMSLPPESSLSLDEKELLSQFKRFFHGPDLHNILQIPTNESECSNSKKSKSQKNTFVKNVGKTKKTKNEKNKHEISNSKEDFNVEVERFLLRKCCANKYLADGGECSINKCHEKWKHVKDGLIKFILIPGQFDFNSSTEDNSIDEINIPQIIFDCDNVNIQKRFLDRDQMKNLCPGSCGNKKTCKRYTQSSKENAMNSEDCNIDEDINKIEILDEHLILMDIKAAWYELKILMFWLYWVSNEGFNDFDEFAIGFETACYCCYCFHGKKLAKSEKLKFYTNLSVKEWNSLHSRCTCHNKKSTGNEFNEKKNLKSDFTNRENKCPFCLSKEKEQASSQSINSSLADYLKYINLPVEKCCCTPTQSNIELSFEENVTPIFVCHKNKNLPAVYVDLTSIDELSAEEVESKVSASTVEFYIAACEKWRENNNAFSKNESSCDYECERCRCNCNKPKFYSLLQIISRITELIDNLVRLDLPFFISMIDAFYSALFCRYSTFLLALYSNGCGFSFFKELTQIVHSIRKCGTWFMQILGPKRLRLSYTLFFALPGQHFLNNIYWKWADAPALDHFLKLSVMLSHDIISHEWRNLVVNFLDILPYLYDAAVLSDIDDIFSLSQQDFEKDDHLSMMYECYDLIQKKYLDKSLVWHMNNKPTDNSIINLEANNHNIIVSKFLKKLTESLKPRKIEIELLSKFCTDAWNDFEKLLAYSLIKAYAIGHFINNEYLNYWIKKVFCFCVDPDASSKCINKTKLSLQIFIDLMGYHKNARRLKYGKNQISAEAHRNKMEILIKAFHLKHFGGSRSRSDKIILKMNRYIMINEKTTKKSEKQFSSDFIQSDMVANTDDFQNLKNTNSSDGFKIFNPVNLLVDFFGALFKKNSFVTKREICTCNFHKNLVFSYNIKKSSKITANFIQSIDDTEVSEYTVDIPENFNYDSIDEMVIDSDNESLNDLSSQSEYDSSDCEVENIKIPSSLIPANFSCAEKKEKWSIFTAKLLSNHASNVSKGELMSSNKKTIINDFIEDDIKNSQTKNDCYTKTYENTMKLISRSTKVENDNLDLDTSVLFENVNDPIDLVMEEKLSDDNEDISSSMLSDAISNLDRSEQFKSVLMSEFNTTMKEIKHLCEIYDTKLIDEKRESNINKTDPTIEEIEDEMQKFTRHNITKKDFILDLHIVCFHIITRNMLQELTSIDKDKQKTSGERKSVENSTHTRKSIGGFYVDDYWVSLKSQFEKWRLVSLKIFKKLINLNKKTSSTAPSFKDFDINLYRYHGYVRGCLAVSAMNHRINDPVKGPSNSTKSYVSMFNIYIATWLFAVTELERLEKIIEKKNESKEISRKKHFEEIREAELLGGRGLSKMINNFSKKPTESTSLSNSQSKKDTTKATTQPLAKKSAFQESVEECLKRFDKSTGSTDSKVDISIKQNSKGDEVTSITFIHTSNKTTKVTTEPDNKQKTSKSAIKVMKSETKTISTGKNSQSSQPKENCTDQNKAVDGVKSKSSTSAAAKDAGKEKCAINHESHEKCYTEGKCPLHPDSSRSNHSQSGDHPCNCCYCTIFGQVPPISGPVSRNLNETRERLRTILNKKKMNEKGKEENKNQQVINENNVKDAEHHQNSQSGNVSTNNTNKTNSNSNKATSNSNTDSILNDDCSKSLKPIKNKEMLTKLVRHTIDDFVKQRKLKKPNTTATNSPDLKANQSSKNNAITTENKNIGNTVKDGQDSKKLNTKPQTKVSNSTNKSVSTSDSVNSSPSMKSESTIDGKSQRCHSCSRVDSKKKQADAPANIPNSDKNNGDDRVTKAPDSKNSSNNALNKFTCYSNTHSHKSSDGSICCCSPICINCGYQDDRDVNMLVKFIEEPHRAADKEKKQAKKARQKNKKLKMELMKEREELHEDLISMVGETSRLREEVVRLEQGLASACRRLPVDKYNNSKHANSTDKEIDLEEHECALLLKRAAQEASARATEAATLAEQAHSRLRHVESALNLLSSSVSRACVKQQKLGQNDETSKKPKNPTQPQPLSSVYNMDQVLYKNSEFYNNSGSSQGMVTIKRVLLPNSEEHGVTITPKGSDHLIYTSQDHYMSSAALDKPEYSENKQVLPRKQNLSWESTIAQINTLANTKRKTKPVPNEKKKNDINSSSDHKPTDNSKKKKDESSSQKNTSNNNSVISQTNVPPVVKKNKKTPVVVETVEEISIEPNLSKKALKKMKKAALKAELECATESKNLGSKINSESIQKVKQIDDNSSAKQKKSKNANKISDMDNIKTDRKNESKKPNTKQDVVEKQSKPVNNKNNKTSNSFKAENSESSLKSQKAVENSQNPTISQKNKKSNQQSTQKASAQQTKSTTQPSKTSPNNQNTSLQIVNSLTSAVDKIKLNDDTTIELASSKKDHNTESEDNLLSAINKNVSVSSSIMEQLRSGVQFADLRLPPGITLTRVDPAKQHNVSKSNIPLMTSATPSAYRPTPPAPPPPAVIMVDTTKLHADRESKLNAPPSNADSKKPSKSKKSKKKNKKSHHIQQTSGPTSVHTSSVNTTNEQPKMVTLRNPMFHSALTPTGMVNLQQPGKRMNDIRLPDPIPMPPNASCQATITPTSNGMYTIRNPLMSMVHQQSMMGMNSMESPPNPLLLMANQHLNTPTPHTYCSNVCDDQNSKNTSDTSVDLKESINNITSRLSNCSLEKCKDESSSFESVPKPDKNFAFKNKSKFSPVSQSPEEYPSNGVGKDDTLKLSESLEKPFVTTPNPIGAARHQEYRKNSIDKQSIHTENSMPKPIGTPFSQYNVSEVAKSPETSANTDQVNMPEPQQFYSPFGPRDADKTFGSILYQPLVRNHSNENIWSTKPDPQSHQFSDEKSRIPPYVQRVGTSKVIVDSDCSVFHPMDPNEQSKNWMNNQVKSDGYCDPKSIQGFQSSQPTHPSVYQQLLYEANKESLINSKAWINGVYPHEQDYYKYYNQFPAGLSPLHHAKLSHSSSSSCVPSDSSSVYDSISNSSSNSPADSTNVNNHNVPDYNYMQPHQMSILKTSGVSNAVDTFVDTFHPMNHEGFNHYSGMKNVAVSENNDKGIPNMWKDSNFSQFKDTYGVVGSVSNNIENSTNYEACANMIGQRVIGSQRASNGLVQNESFFTESSSVFAPDQSITNLNELDSSERDIESFKRFDYYFEPPKNKPKISLNVQDIAFQRPSPTKPAYRNN